MTGSRLRKPAWALAVLLGLMQPLVGSPARALAIVASHGHGHQVSVVADSGHLDLVLSHVANSEEHPLEHHLHALPDSDSTHVMHLTSTDAGRDCPRRTAETAVASFPWHVMRSPESPAPANAAGAPLTVAPILVRTVVLRI